MSLARGKFGIEYDPRQMEKDPSGLGWIVALVALVALVSFGWTFLRRMRSSDDALALVEPAVVAAEPSSVDPQGRPASSAAEQPPAKIVARGGLERRPVKVRNLLMRLEEAERSRDMEMAVSTIEQIRALPGSPAADLDDALARRLGTLNVRRLFEKHNPQWVKTIEVKRGDSASRIASENGSTLAAFKCLNGGDVDKVVLGAKMYVMDHPRFNLVIHRRSRTADLSLNGKFFRRYDIVGDVKGAEGAYEIPARLRGFWERLGVAFKVADRTEIEMLMPTGSPVLLSEM